MRGKSRTVGARALLYSWLLPPLLIGAVRAARSGSSDLILTVAIFAATLAVGTLLINHYRDRIGEVPLVYFALTLIPCFLASAGVAWLLGRPTLAEALIFAWVVAWPVTAGTYLGSKRPPDSSRAA